MRPPRWDSTHSTWPRSRHEGLRDDGAEVEVEVERIWVAQHEHDDEVGSFAIERTGDVDPDRLNAWLSEVHERGIDLFRMKGFLSTLGSPTVSCSRVYTCCSTDSQSGLGATPRLNRRFHRPKPRPRPGARLRRAWLSGDEPRGVMRDGSSVGDYAIDGGWACNGKVLVLGDAAGGVYAFEDVRKTQR